MTEDFFLIAAAIGYLFGSVAYGAFLMLRQPALALAGRAATVLAVVLHTVAIGLHCAVVHQTPFTTPAETLSASAWAIALAYLGLELLLKPRPTALGAVALPAAFAPEREGGREHDLLLDAAGGRWLKFTKPFAAGFTVAWTGERFERRPGTPLQYLQRWRLANRLFGGGACLVGLSCLGRTQRIVVSQAHVPGDPPTWDEIDRALARTHGLRRLPLALTPADDLERRAYARGRLAVFDVCPANGVRTADGEVVLIDSVPILFRHPVPC